jgi:hypothetical protein
VPAHTEAEEFTERQFSLGCHLQYDARNYDNFSKTDRILKRIYFLEREILYKIRTSEINID